MSVEIPSFVLDSFALLSHFQDEKSSGRIVSLLEQAQQGECRVVMSLINLGEVCCLIERRRGFQAVQLAIAVTESLPIEILPVDREIVFAAAHLKAQYRISYADAFAAAAAQAHAATLITGDPELEALKNVIELEWLNPLVRPGASTTDPSQIQ